MPMRHDFEPRREFNSLDVDPRLCSVAEDCSQFRIARYRRCLEHDVLRQPCGGLLGTSWRWQKCQPKYEKCTACRVMHGSTSPVGNASRPQVRGRRLLNYDRANVSRPISRVMPALGGKSQ